jgi:hypothetical protein
LLELAEAKLNVVTAISNNDDEEAVAHLLHSQGCNIIFRALNLQLLTEFLSRYDLDIIVIYSKEFLTTSHIEELLINSSSTKFIELSPGVNKQFLLGQLAQVSRPPLIHQLARVNKLTAVFGSLASPGISTITNHLALATSARIIAPTHHNLRPLTTAQVDVIGAAQLDKTLSDIGSDPVVIDAGACLNLTKILSDRRASASWLSQSLICAKSIIYVVKANDNGMIYLSEFVSDFKKVINPPKILYVLNQQRFDRKGEVIQAKFLELIGSQIHVQVPYDRRSEQSQTGGLARFWRNTTFNKQIAKIGSQQI